ncbi:DNA mismatch repair protein MutL [Actinoplanes sp. CA-051413]|uniref:DNA mismatch repair protein MutL n=1 Tax=Actinoplanes sp. CA-051413 TaxID=3239899 RepID=UPI003D98DC5B
MLPVLRTATPDESSLVSVDQLRDSGQAGPSPLPPPSTSPTAEPEPEPSATTTRTRRPTSEPARTSATPSPPRTTTTTAPAESTTTTEDGWTVTTDGDGSKSYVRSFRVEGGSAVIRVTEDNVKVVTATPSDGFSVATVQNSPDNLAVYFNEVNHSFIIHVAWNINKPFAEVSEIGE